MTHRESGACPVVVGAGPIGMYVAARLAEYQRVVVIDADPASPESTERRTQFLRSLEVATYPSGLPAQHRRKHSRIEFRPGCRLIAIDRQAKRVVTQRGERIPYQHLVLALGAGPVVPAFAECQSFPTQT